jgi:hypothetical protein
MRRFAVDLTKVASAAMASGTSRNDAFKEDGEGKNVAVHGLLPP